MWFVSLLIDNHYYTAGNETCVSCPTGTHADSELVAKTRTI